MASQHHVRLVRQGEVAVRQWRQKQRQLSIKLDLENADLSGEYLHQVDLREADLSGANLTGTCLYGADLYRADLRGANLTKADFKNAILSDACLYGVFDNTDFRNASLCRAAISGDLSKGIWCNSSGNNFHAAHFDGALFDDVIWQGAVMRGVCLATTDLSGQNLSTVDFTGACFRSANLSGANLNGANLTGVDLSTANLSRVTMKGAILRGAIFNRATISEADLTEADFTDAHLMFCRIEDSRFLNTHLDNAVMGWTRLCSLDLSCALGLETVTHLGPSTVGIDTIAKSGKRLSEVLLTACGIPCESLSRPVGDLSRSVFSEPVCICYLGTDGDFAEKLRSRLGRSMTNIWSISLETIEKDLKQIAEHSCCGSWPPKRYQDFYPYRQLIVVMSDDSLRRPKLKTFLIDLFEQQLQGTRQINFFPVRLCNNKSLREWSLRSRDRKNDIAAQLRSAPIPDFQNWHNQSDFELAARHLVAQLERNS